MKKHIKYIVLIALILGFPCKTLAMVEEQVQLSERARIARGLFNDGLYSLAIKELERYREEGVIDADSCPRRDISNTDNAWNTNNNITIHNTIVPTNLTPDTDLL